MGNFRMKIDVEPNEIPSLDDPHKQDCADSINRSINSTFKYTMIFAFAVIGVFAVYTIFGLVYILRMQSPLPDMSPVLPGLALLIIIFEIIAGTMKRWALFTEVILHIALVITALTGIQSAIAVPFAIYGIYLHIKLLTLFPYYDVISQLRGYPDFTALPIGDVIKKVNTEETASGDQENVSLIKQEESQEQAVSEKTDPVPEETQEKPQEQADSGKTGSVPEETQEIPAEEPEETDSAAEKQAPPRKSNNSSRNRKKKKKKRSSK